MVVPAIGCESISKTPLSPSIRSLRLTSPKCPEAGVLSRFCTSNPTPSSAIKTVSSVPAQVSSTRNAFARACCIALVNPCCTVLYTAISTSSGRRPSSSPVVLSSSSSGWGLPVGLPDISSRYDLRAGINPRLVRTDGNIPWTICLSLRSVPLTLLRSSAIPCLTSAGTCLA